MDSTKCRGFEGGFGETAGEFHDSWPLPLHGSIGQLHWYAVLGLEIVFLWLGWGYSASYKYIYIYLIYLLASRGIKFVFRIGITNVELVGAEDFFNSMKSEMPM